MAALTLQSVEQALAKLVDPVFERSMSELGLLSDVKLDGRRLSLRVQLSAPAGASKERITRDLQELVGPLGVHEVDLLWDLQVPARQASADDPVPEVRNIVLVMSGKGGVGKSTCAFNLALALSQAGARVGALDADIYGPSLPTMMGVHGNPRSLDGKRIEPLRRLGVTLMSIGFMLEDPKQAVIWRGPMLQGALQQFLGDVNWGTLDYLILDLPPGTGDVALTLAQRLRTTGVVIVTTPQEVALQDVYKAVSMCDKLKLRVLGVLENMSYFVDPQGARHEIFGAGGGQKVADYAKAPLLGQIPIDPLVRQWGDDGTPVVEAAPKSTVASAFRDVAERLATRIAREHFVASGGQKAPPVAGHKRLKIIR